MNRTLSRVAILATCIQVQACGGLSRVQDPVARFDQGVQAATTREKDFLRKAQLSDCYSQFYTQATAWNPRNKLSHFDLSGNCTPRVLTDQQVSSRAALMDALALYADKLNVISSSNDTSKLDDNSQKLATSINNIAKTGGLKDLSIASAVEAGVIAIAEMVLDQRRFNDVRSAAMEMQKYIKSIVDALKAENTNFAAGVASNLSTAETNVRAAVAVAGGRGERESFFKVVEGREMLREANPFGTVPISSTTGGQDSNTNPEAIAVDLNNMLEAIATANEAIATANSGGIIAAVEDLAARGKAAQTLQTSLNK